MRKIISADSDIVSKTVLLHSDAECLIDSLDRLYRHQSTAENVSHRLMLRFAYELMDNNSTVQAALNGFNQSADEIERRACSEYDKVGDRMKRNVDDELARMMERINERCDALNRSR